MNKRQLLGMVGAALVTGVLGYVAHAARAGGVPTSPNTMAYTGTLTNTAGAPVAGKGVVLSIWDAGSAGNAACGPYTAATTASDGSFKVGLDDACVAAVHAHPNLWIQIQVVGEAQPMPRTQMGAVPYAVEASRTVVNANGKLYSAGATYCGSTATPYTGDLKTAVPGSVNGYAAGKSLCETTCGSTSAHMCGPDEITRSMAIGIAVPELATGSWYSTATYAAQGGTQLLVDCYDWEKATSGYAAAWIKSGTFGGASFAACTSALPILCCD